MPRISLMTASRLSSAIFRPSRMCARASALRSSNSMRRRTTSRRKSMKCSIDLEQAEHLRPAGDDRQRDDAERLLQLRLLEQVVQHHLADFAALELDHDPHAVAIGLVAQIGNAFERLVAHQFGDALEQPRLVQLIRNLGDDDLLAIALLRRFDLGLRAHLDRAAAGERRPRECRACRRSCRRWGSRGRESAGSAP